MENNTLQQLQYPIGHFNIPVEITKAQIAQWIKILENYPTRLETLVVNLSPEQLETPYRPEGWTVRQVIHHLADSHHHSYTRFKWALTEDKPVIKAYDEKEWSTLFDARTAPIELSLVYLKAVHEKMVYFLKGLSESALEQVFIHPSGHKAVSVKENIGRYAWHSEHHYAHIYNLLKRKGWMNS